MLTVYIVKCTFEKGAFPMGPKFLHTINNFAMYVQSFIYTLHFSAVRCENVTVSTSRIETLTLTGHYGQKRHVPCGEFYGALNGTGYTAECQTNRTWSNIVNCTSKRSLITSWSLPILIACLYEILTMIDNFKSKLVQKLST